MCSLWISSSNFQCRAFSRFQLRLIMVARRVLSPHANSSAWENSRDIVPPNIFTLSVNQSVGRSFEPLVVNLSAIRAFYSATTGILAVDRTQFLSAFCDDNLRNLVRISWTTKFACNSSSSTALGRLTENLATTSRVSFIRACAAMYKTRF